MEIRPASDEDIDAIVDLLKLSLGNSLTPKSVAYWRWKHIDNPFGRSPVLLAWDGPKLIGVRAFMNWKWVANGAVVRAVRAVDTATHPDYQGKGIFYKLTMALIEKCQGEDIDFIFNTPNKKSGPGYLKMGWQKAGKLPIRFSIQRPFNILKNCVAHRRNADNNFSSNELNKLINNPSLDEILSQHRNSCPLTTFVDREYLQWRYAQIPIAKYFAVVDSSNGSVNGFVIARIKNTRVGKELRITESVLPNDMVVNRFNKYLREIKKSLRIDYISSSGVAHPRYQKIPGKLGGILNIGPMVTIRSIKNEDLTSLRNFSNWSPTLGDLEIF